MSRFDFARPGNQYGGVPVPNQADFGRIDIGCQWGLNGDGGGTYAPSKEAIAIGGAGMSLTAATTKIEGGVVTQRGGRCVHGVNDFAAFSPSRSRTVVFSLRTNVNTYAQELPITPGLFGTTGFVMPAYGLYCSGPAGESIYLPLPSRHLHQGANLATITLSMRVLKPRTGGAPAVTPAMTFVRVSQNGTPSNLASGSFGAPASGDAWYNHGNPQTLALAVGATVDVTQYSYYVKVIDEGGANSAGGNIYHSVAAAFTGIADMRFA